MYTFHGLQDPRLLDFEGAIQESHALSSRRSFSLRRIFSSILIDSYRKEQVQ